MWIAPPSQSTPENATRLSLTQEQQSHLLDIPHINSLTTILKSPIQPTNTKLNTADGSPMTALGMTVLHLRIADFKFTHSFNICDRLLDTEKIFNIDAQKKFSISYAWDKAKTATYKEMENS